MQLYLKDKLLQYNYYIFIIKHFQPTKKNFNYLKKGKKNSKFTFLLSSKLKIASFL